MGTTALAQDIGSWGIVAFTLYWTYALLTQAARIWRTKSGASISVTWMLYFFFLCPVYGSYGIETDKWPMVVHGFLRGLCYIPIMIGLLKYKGFYPLEKLLTFVLLAVVIVMVTTNLLPIIFSVAAFGGVLAALLQPIEIAKKKSVGVLDPNMILVMFLSNTFWTIFSVATQDLYLIFLCVLYFVPIVATGILWRRYRLLA